MFTIRPWLHEARTHYGIGESRFFRRGTGRKCGDCQCGLLSRKTEMKHMGNPQSKPKPTGGTGGGCIFGSERWHQSSLYANVVVQMCPVYTCGTIIAHETGELQM